MTIGDRIRKQRESVGISQTELAEKVNVSKQTLYKYENNIITNIPSDKIEGIARVIGVSPGYLMGWERPPVENAEKDADIVGNRKLRQAMMKVLELPEEDREAIYSYIDYIYSKKQTGKD